MLNLANIIESIRKDYKVSYTTKNFEKRFNRLTGLELMDMKTDLEAINEFKKAYNKFIDKHGKTYREEKVIVEWESNKISDEN